MEYLYILVKTQNQYEIMRRAFDEYRENNPEVGIRWEYGGGVWFRVRCFQAVPGVNDNWERVSIDITRHEGTFYIVKHFPDGTAVGKVESKDKIGDLNKYLKILVNTTQNSEKIKKYYQKSNFPGKGWFNYVTFGG